MGYGRWGGPDTGGGRLNTRLWTERRKKDERREDTGKMFGRARRPDESRRGGGKEGTQIISEGKHRNFKNRHRV